MVFAWVLCFLKGQDPIELQRERGPLEITYCPPSWQDQCTYDILDRCLSNLFNSALSQMGFLILDFISIPKISEKSDTFSVHTDTSEKLKM